VGTWTLVSITLEKDGKKTDFYGPNPQGQATWEASGRVSGIVIRSDLPKFEFNNRQAGTPEENIYCSQPPRNSRDFDSRLELPTEPLQGLGQLRLQIAHRTD
jgi:hypothetical protein